MTTEVPRPTTRRRALRVWAIVVAAVLAVPLVALGVFLVAVPPPVDDFDPEAWRPAAVVPSPAGITAPAEPEALSGESIDGPEDVVVDGAGNLYTGDRGGTIWRIPPGGGPAQRFAEPGGRPLGLAFAPDGRLIVANHGEGLQAIGPDGVVEVLVDEVAGEPILFANDLDVSADGIVYFSDSSSRYNTTILGDQSSSYLFPDAIDGRASGRLLSHDLGTGESRVLVDDLYFPNGVALTADGTGLWVAESNRYRVLRHDLDDGSTQVVLENLPGTPDNIDRDADGRMLVAVYDRVAVLDDLVLPYTVSRQILIRLPTELFVNEDDPLSGSIVVAADDGTVLAHLTDLTPAATSVFPAGDRWYLGALLGQPVRWMPSP